MNCQRELSNVVGIIAQKIANGYEMAKSRHIFRDFIDATANISIAKRDITVNFQKRAHNPFLIAANFDKIVTSIPWLENRKLHILLG